QPKRQVTHQRQRAKPLPSKTVDRRKHRMKLFVKVTVFLSLLAAVSNCAFAQSRHTSKGGDLEGTLLTVTASRTDGKSDAIKIESLSLYENGFEQKIRNFSFDPSPSRIVLLVDNSQ